MHTEDRLDLARQLVSALQGGRASEANALLAQLNDGHSTQILRQLMELTRDVHQAFGELVSDRKLMELTAHAMPDARGRLSYVIEKTEEAAHRTLEAVEEMMPLAERLTAGAGTIAALAEHRSAALWGALNGFVREVGDAGERLQSGLSEVLMAQEYQDLTGQVIKRTIEIVAQVEHKLIGLLTQERLNALGAAPPPAAGSGVQGPAIRPAANVMDAQTEVDDLLAELGV